MKPKFCFVRYEFDVRYQKNDYHVSLFCNKEGKHQMTKVEIRDGFNFKSFSHVKNKTLYNMLKDESLKALEKMGFRKDEDKDNS